MKTTLAESLLWASTSLCVALLIVSGSMMGNVNEVNLADVVRSLVVLGVFAVLLTLGLMALAPSLGRLFPTVLYGYFAFFSIKYPASGFEYRYVVACIWIVTIILVFHLGLWRHDRLFAAACGLTIAAVVATATFAMMAPVLLYSPPNPIATDFRDRTLAVVERHGSTDATLPDIIYVVPDRYPGATTLMREYGMDNGPFYAALEARGFVVEGDAHANYPKTFQSLASTLNGGYLDSFTTTYGVDSSHLRPVFETIEDNVVQDRLRSLGYRYHHHGGWWEPTRLNRWADVNDTGSRFLNRVSEFERALIDRTLIWDVVGLFEDPGEREKFECRRIKRKFQLLEEVGNGPEPVFVFAHVGIPHEPIVVDASGNCLDRPLRFSSAEAWDDYKAAFAEYVRYFNAAILQVMDRQIEKRQPSGRRLLFVIQSDEGPFPLVVHQTGKYYDFSTLTRRELQMKMGTINALRLPPGTNLHADSIATPVNNWRIIFNALTGSNLKMLPHKIYVYPSANHLYQFCDATAFVTGKDVLSVYPCPQ